MITQIYSLQTPEDALACVEAGTDYIGTNPSGKNQDITLEEGIAKTKKIFDAIDGKATKVAITIDNTKEEIDKIITELNPDVLHICGNDDDCTPQQAEYLHKTYPGLRILQAVAMSGPEAIEKGVYFSEFCDILILDSVVPNVIGVGAAGITHDWAWDRAIVEQAKCPVIIAGGLGPDNVEAAIRQVKPWGVDSLTKTNKTGSDDKGGKDIEKVRAFCETAHRVGEELGI